MGECRKYDGEDMQNVVERLLKAGWLKSAHVTAHGFALEVTEKGHTKMRALADLVKPFAPAVFGVEKRKTGLLDWMKLLSKWAFAAAELRPPKFTGGQRDTLISLVLNYSLDEGKPGVYMLSSVV